MIEGRQLTLADYVLLASLDLTNGDLEKNFTAEELLVASWRRNPEAFGLRGFEREHPDSNKLYTRLDGRDGLVARGLFVKAGERVLRLTSAGLAAGASLHPGDPVIQAKLHRVLQEQVAKLIGCSSWTVRQRHIRSGLPHFRAGTSGKLIFYRDQVVRWIESHQKGGKIR